MQIMAHAHRWRVSCGQPDVMYHCIHGNLQFISPTAYQPAMRHKTFHQVIKHVVNADQCLAETPHPHSNAQGATCVFLFSRERGILGVVSGGFPGEKNPGNVVFVVVVVIANGSQYPS